MQTKEKKILLLHDNNPIMTACLKTMALKYQIDAFMILLWFYHCTVS